MFVFLRLVPDYLMGMCRKKNFALHDKKRRLPIWELMSEGVS